MLQLLFRLRLLGSGALSLALGLGLLAATSGCVANRMYRPHAIEQGPGYSLAFIELDDHGEFWSPSQLLKTLELIRQANESHPEGAIVALYVHGWNHNASPKDEEGPQGNVYGFKQMLSWIRSFEVRRDGHTPRPVIGVYLGWRGKLGLGPLNVFTFYNRRQAAQRVAGIAATEAVYRVVGTAKEKPSSRVVLMGHSFGGMVLEQTLSQALVGSLFTPREEQRQRVRFPAELVVLINPASPAIHAKQMVEVLTRNRLKLYREDTAGQVREQPLVVSITSRGDWATGLFFPLSLQLKAALTNFRDYGDESCGATARQRDYITRTAGHLPLLHSHRVTAEPLREGQGYSSVEQLPLGIESIGRWEFDPETQQQVVTFEGERHRFRLKRQRRSFNDSPYWILQVPDSLIPDHSKIFGFNTFRLLGALLASTGALTPDGSTYLVREDGIRPIGIAPDGSGTGVLFLDRSRRLFRIAGGGEEPRFFSCLPAGLDPADGLGFTHYEGVYYTSTRERERSGMDWETHIRRATIRRDEVAQEGSHTLASRALFTGATFDVPGRRAFLLGFDDEVIWTADLEDSFPAPRPLATIDGGGSLADLVYQTGRKGLFTVSADGTLYGLDLREPTPVVQRIADGLGWITAAHYDVHHDRLLLADALERRVWTLDCTDGATCGGPRLLVSCEHLSQPSTLQTTADGRLWIGDITAQVIVRVSPDGQVEHVFEALPEISGP